MRSDVEGVWVVSLFIEVLVETEVEGGGGAVEEEEEEAAAFCFTSSSIGGVRTCVRACV